MNSFTNHSIIARGWTLCAFFAISTLALALEPRPYSILEDSEQIRQELWRAKKLIQEQHDFSPIHEAFTAKDLALLWHYYTVSFSIPLHRFLGRGPYLTDDILASLSPEREQRIRLNREQYKLAGDCLMKIPGHARYIGEIIEDAICGRTNDGGKRATLFACLCTLGQDGSDECIEQLGRYLFDKRDPGFQPYDPAQPKLSIYDTRGVADTVQSDATGSLLGVLNGRFEFAKALVDETSVPIKGMPIKGYEDKLREWWLTSSEAAPYRRSLASTGVVLPPGYPPMKELEGTKTTIAPPLKHPPYPDGVEPPSPPQPPADKR